MGPLHESEHHNFLFTVKSGGWANVKKDYNKVGEECVPFLHPLDNILNGEIKSAESSWSDW